MKRLAAIMGLCVLLLAGCGLKAGTVTSKKFIPAYSETVMIPIQVSQTCTTANNVTSCVPIFVPFPFQVDHPNDWVLKLRDGKKTGTVHVSQATYDAVKIGDWYGVKKTDKAPSERRTRLS